MPQGKYPDDEFQKKPVISASQLLGGESSDNFGSYEAAPIQSEARPVKQANEWMQPMNAPTEYAQAKPENQFMKPVSIPTEAKRYPSIQSETRTIKPENQFIEQVGVPTEKYPTAAPLLKGAAPVQNNIFANRIKGQIDAAKAEAPAQDGQFSDIIKRQIETAKAKAQEPKKESVFQEVINRQIETAKAKAQEPKKESVFQDIIKRQIETAKTEAQEPKQESVFQDIIKRQIESAKAAEAEEQAKLSLTDAGALTTGGQFVEDETLRGLQTGEFAGIQSQANRTDRNRAARDYMISKRAKERAANSGFAPGSKQYQDIMAQAQSEIASGNLAGEQALNQATRDEFKDYMNRASGIESERFGRAVGERGFRYQREDVDYLRNEKDKITDKSDATNVINNIKDQKAKQELLKALTDGGISGFKAKLNEVIGEGGTIAEEFRSSSTIDTMFQEAEEWVNRLNPKQAGESDEVWKARNAKAIQDRVKEIDTAKRQPLKAATDTVTDQQKSAQAVIDYKAGTKQLNDISESEWKSMTTRDFESMDIEKVTDATTFTEYGEFKESGLTADVEITAHKGLTGGWDKNTESRSAGAGKGSVVSYNGKPYRIIKFIREMDEDWTSPTDIRGTYTLTPLKGTGANVSISSGWEDV